MEALRDASTPALESLRPEDVPNHFGMDAYRHEFNYCSATLVQALCSPDARFGIVQCRWVGHQVVVVSEFVEFDVFIASFATLKQTKPSTRDPAVRRVEYETMAGLLEAFPWLNDDEVMA